MKKVILASLLATMMSTSPVWATDSATAAPAAPATAAAHDAGTERSRRCVLQVAVQGANAMRDIQFARLALFHGQPDSAKKLTRRRRPRCWPPMMPAGRSCEN